MLTDEQQNTLKKALALDYEKDIIMWKPLKRA